MKNLIRLLTLSGLVPLVLAACTGDDDLSGGEVPSTTGFGNRVLSLTALRTGNSVWKIGDSLTVTDGEHAATFEVATGIATPEGHFQGSLDTDAPILYAVMPAADTEGTVVRSSVAANQTRETLAQSEFFAGSCSEVLRPEGSRFTLTPKTARLRIALDLHSDDGRYAEETIGSIRVTASGRNLAGESSFDLADPAATLSGSTNSITYTFRNGPSLEEPIEVEVVAIPGGWSGPVLWEVSGSRYTFTFNKRPAEPLEAGAVADFALRLGDFTVTGAEIPAEGEVRIDYQLPALDLNENGTANSYIVDGEARCSFDATVMGNGDGGLIAGGSFTDYLGNLLSTTKLEPVSAEVLWTTDEELISEVMLVNGRVTFNSSGREGNALIVVKDAEGRIMWSWHIWCTDTPADHLCMANRNGNVYTFMDRNLGAVSPLEDVGSLGLHYQWGRKDPLPGAQEFNSLTEPVVYGAQTVVEIVDAPVDLAYAIQHPMTFVKGAGWLAGSQNDALWGNPKGAAELMASAPKSIYDPCPVGYKVPARDAYSIFTATGADATAAAEYNIVFSTSDLDAKQGWYLYYTAYGSGPQSWWPSNGCRYYSNAALNRGSYYYYWTSAPLTGTKACATAVRNNKAEIKISFDMQRGNAQAIRCVREQ